MRKEIRLSGAGGQGIITAGIILAKAASIYDNLQAIQTQSYGPEARGGASKAEVIISEYSINYPKIEHPDFLLAMTKEAYNKYTTDLKKDAIVIVDSTNVKVDYANNKIYSLPILYTAQNDLGNILTANIVSLGAINAIMNFVSKDALINAVIETFPMQFKENNLKALTIGEQIANKI